MWDLSSFWCKNVLLSVLSLIQLFLLSKSLNLLELSVLITLRNHHLPLRGLQPVLTAKTVMGQGFSPSELVLLSA